MSSAAGTPFASGTDDSFANRQRYAFLSFRIRRYAPNRIAPFSMAAWLPYCQVMLRCSCPIGRPE